MALALALWAVADSWAGWVMAFAMARNRLICLSVLYWWYESLQLQKQNELGWCYKDIIRTNTICSFYGTCPARLAGLTSGKNLPIRKQRQFFRKKENATFLFSIFKFCCVILIYSILLWCFIWTSRERVHKKPGKNPKVCVWGNFEWGKKHWNHALWPL